MKKTATRRDKYFLRDIHQEIDLYDRKLADLDKFGEFASAAGREEAEQKLLSKRALLERTARELAASGVAFDERELPRSFRVNALDQSGAPKTLTVSEPV